MKIYLYPSYVGLVSAEMFSPGLFQFFRDQGLQLEDARWDGTLASLPQNEPSIIRASSQMKCSSIDLARCCAEHGHIVFYDDRVLLPDGNYDGPMLLEGMKKFLSQHQPS